MKKTLYASNNQENEKRNLRKTIYKCMFVMDLPDKYKNSFLKAKYQKFLSLEINTILIYK